MAVDKFSVSMPEELVDALDELADVDGLTRSGVLREATARYVASREAAARQDERGRSIDAALKAFDEIASEWGQDDQAGVDYLREIRGGHSRLDVDRGPDGTE